MSELERVLNFVREICHGTPSGHVVGVDAGIVSEELGIWKNDAVQLLNRLVEQGALQKKGSKPIRYLPTFTTAPSSTKEDDGNPGKVESPPFSRIVGYNGSLRLQTQLAEAAVAYPPDGMHTLITGETGVGKSLMAEEMWRCRQQLCIGEKREVPYVVFNCAEYADNPQLLLGQLFGYEKGAFTGAESSHAGLVERANGGVLFLDEIHRLPATGQEMFFTLLDKGLSRRMGSTTDRHVDLMIIGATTEYPSNVFLDTFKRRIPMHIQIPPLKERPIIERVSLIGLFLSREAKRLNTPIRITAEAMKMIAAYQGKSNIGELKNELQLCCARSYLAYLNSQKNTPNEVSAIHIDRYSLSRQITMVSETETTEKPDSLFLAQSFNKEILISPESGLFSDTDTNPLNPVDFYSFVEDRIKSYSKAHKSSQEIEQMVSVDLNKHYNDVLYGPEHAVLKDAGDFDLYGSFTSEVLAATSELLRLATCELKRNYPEMTYVSLAFYLEQAKDFARADSVMHHTPLNIPSSRYPRERAFVMQKLPMLKNALGIQFTEDEISIVSMLLGEYAERKAKKRVGLVIVAHGGSTASSVAEFTNEILMEDIAQPVDACIDRSPDETLQDICSAVSESDEGRGVVVLCDTESFCYYENAITERTGVRCRVIPSVSTVLALEVCKSIQTTEEDVDEIVTSVVREYRQYLTSLFDRLEQPEKRQATQDAELKNVIITYCITGMGSARIIREQLLKHPAISIHTDILPMGVKDDIQGMAKKLGGRLKFVIGLLDPGLPGVPFFSVEKLARKEGINSIMLLLRGWNTHEVEAHWVHEDLSLGERLERVNTSLYYFAPNLEQEAVSGVAGNVVESLQKLYDEDLPPDLWVRVYIHTATMFERIHTSEPIPMPADGMHIVENNHSFFLLLQDIMHKACKALGLTLPVSEVYYFMLTLPNPQTMQTLWE